MSPAVENTPLVRAVIPAHFEEEFDPLESIAAARSAALAMGTSFEVFVVGGSRATQGETIAREALRRGAAKAWLCQHDGLAEDATAEQCAHACIDAWGAAEGAGTVGALLTLSPACNAGEELAARLATRLGAAALGQIAAVAPAATGAGSGFHVIRAAFGGRALATLHCRGHGCGVMRGDANAAGCVAESASALQRVVLTSVLPARPEVESSALAQGQRRLHGAKVVVSGGRGMGGPDGFAHLQALADALGGALGGSLPSVDAGWVPVSRQVGQSGCFVRPELYVAVGISGTPQHLAGIGPEARIVAINNDPAADIFKVAEIGCVGEWQEIVPRLLARLRAGN